MNPLVSVIMPAYNRSWSIATSIESVLSQTYSDLELIVVDDGSTDETSSVVQQFEDERVRYAYQANQGPKAARNHGLELARGKWISYLDSDDELHETCLEVMVQHVEAGNAVFAMPRAKRLIELWDDGKLVKVIDDSADTPPEFTLHDLFMRKSSFAVNGFFHLSSIVSAEIRWDLNCLAMEDWEFAMTLGEHYPDGFLYVPVVLHTYHQRFGRDGAVSKFSYGDWADTFEYIYEKHKNAPQLREQTWYPAKVQKWRDRQERFERGELPPYSLHYFEGLDGKSIDSQH